MTHAVVDFDATGRPVYVSALMSHDEAKAHLELLGTPTARLITAEQALIYKKMMLHQV